MIPTFLQSILSVKDPQLDKQKPEDNVLYQLKCINIALVESEEMFYNPQNFCKAFKDWDGNPINVFEQMDVDEFFNQLMDKLEN